jgi:hypothetical protein
MIGIMTINDTTTDDGKHPDELERTEDGASFNVSASTIGEEERKHGSDSQPGWDASAKRDQRRRNNVWSSGE